MDETHKSLMIAEWELCRLHQELLDAADLLDAVADVDGVGHAIRQLRRATGLILSAANSLGKPLADAEQKLTV